MAVSLTKDMAHPKSEYFCLPNQENQIPSRNQVSWRSEGGCPGLESEEWLELPSLGLSTISANPNSASLTARPFLGPDLLDLFGLFFSNLKSVNLGDIILNV